MANTKLFIGGVVLMALRSILEQFVDRSGRATDTTDFLFGLMFGVGLGLLLLFVWRLGKQPPPPGGRVT